MRRGVKRGRRTPSRRTRNNAGRSAAAQSPGKAILSPTHPRWNELVARLSGQAGCDFQEHNGELNWRCEGGRKRPRAKAILNTMGGVDVKRTLKMLAKYGCDCDCSIVLEMNGR